MNGRVQHRNARVCIHVIIGFMTIQYTMIDRHLNKTRYSLRFVLFAQTDRSTDKTVTSRLNSLFSQRICPKKN